MIVTKCTRKGIEYSGSPELLEALPSGMLRKIEATFGLSYPTIYNNISGLRWSNDNKVLDCAIKLVQLHQGIKYDERVENILSEYTTNKKAL